MVAFSQKRMASLTLLSIMLPISLLAGFRIAGIISEPPETHTITVDTVTWNMTRPAQILTRLGVASSSYADTEAMVEFDVSIAGYRENWDFLGFGYVDVVDLGIVTSSNTSDGYITSMSIEFLNTDADANFIIDTTASFIELHNLAVRRVFRTPSEAGLETAAVQKPKDASLSIVTFWVFSDKNNRDHWATITLEVTFLSEGVFKEVRIPLLLGVLSR